MSEAGSADAPVSVRSFFGETLAYGFVETCNKAIGLLLLPVIALFLSPADYGLLSLFGVTATILFMVFSVGMPYGFFRFYTDTRDDTRRGLVLDTAFWIATASSALWGTILFLGASWVDRALFQVEWGGYSRLLAVVVYLRFVDMFARSRLRADGRVWTFVWISLVYVLLSRGLSLTFIMIGMGPWGWVVGECAALVVTVGLLAFASLRDLRFRTDARTCRELIPYGCWLVPVMLSHWVMTGADKYLLRALVDNPLTQIGLYTVGERVSSVMQMVTVAVLQGWQRFAFRNMHHPEGPRLLSRGMTHYVIGAGYAALALALLGDDLTHWLIPSDFEAGVRVIPALTLACFFSGWADMASIGLHKVNRTSRLGVLSGSAAALNIALNLAFIPRYGILGAAYTTLACQALRAFATWRASQRCLVIPLELRRIVTAVLCYSAVFGAGQLLHPFGWAASSVGQTILVGATPLVMLAAGFFTDAERGYVVGLFRRGIAIVTGKTGDRKA